MLDSPKLLSSVMNDIRDPMGEKGRSARLRRCYAVGNVALITVSKLELPYEFVMLVT